jgi:hypothetical protein
MTDPVFGLKITRDTTESISVITSDMSITAIWGTAPDADPSVFEENYPVRMASNDANMLAALGTDGTIPDAINAINDALGDYQSAATLVIIRVAEGANDFETIQNIIGTEAGQTGLYAAPIIGDLLGLVPRLWIIPGYCHQALNRLDKLTPAVAGTNYVDPPAVSFSGGGSDPNKRLPAAHAVLGSTSAGTAGRVVAYIVDDPGTNITGPLVVTVAAPPAAADGQPASVTATATPTIDVRSNAVVAALPGLLNRCIAHAVAEGPGTTEADGDAWRETINCDRIIPVDMWCNIQVGDTIVARPGAGRVVGIGIRRDYERNGVPSGSWANQPVNGIVSFVRKVPFSLTDGALEGQRLLLNNIGVGVRGELGVATAIANSGYIFVGTDVATDDPLWQFYSTTRMRDYIHLGFIRTLRNYLGKTNITRQTVRAILNTMDTWLNDLQADGHILGHTVGFEADKNSPDNIRLGRLRVNFQAEESPVLRRIDIDSRRYRPALDSLVNEIISDASNPGASAAAAST